MSAYPDWVNVHKVKGTTVKKVGGSYYLYKSTSRRVPGKKYPQPIQQFIGTITTDGLVKSMMRKVSTEAVRVYEYGFSRTLREILPAKFTGDIRDKEKAELAFLNIVRHFSPDSYLLRGMAVPSMDEIGMSFGVQKKKLERLMGVAINELLPLSGIYLVETKECDMISEITPGMEALMSGLGVGWE